MRIYLPRFNGDFRIEEDPEDKTRTILVVNNPTPAEVEALKRFEKKAVKKGWTEVGKIHEREKTVLVAPYQDVGLLLLDIFEMKGRRGILTAVAFEGGKLRVTDVIDDDLPRWLKTAEDDGGQAAAVVTRPTLSCPEVGGRMEKRDQLAEEVLLAFLSAEQKNEWRRDRAITVFGGRTGYCYRVHGRDTQTARRLGRITFDVTNRTVLHHHLETVPAAEEVLSVAVILQTREHWLRVHGEVDRPGKSIMFSSPMKETDNYVPHSAQRRLWVSGIDELYEGL